MVFSVSICGYIYIKIHIGFEMLCYDAILAKTGIFKGMSQLFDIKSVHLSIIPLTAQALLSPIWMENSVCKILWKLIEN